MPERLNRHFAERYSPPAELQRTISEKLRLAEQARQAADTRACWLILLGDAAFTALTVSMLWLIVGSGLWLTLAIVYGLVSVTSCALITLAKQMQGKQGFLPKVYSLVI